MKTPRTRLRRLLHRLGVVALLTLGLGFAVSTAAVAIDNAWATRPHSDR